ncbi:AAA family ATPase [soil metagenome]
MHVIFLYGPPAVGKLTIALELQKKLGYKLLHNHLIIDLFDHLFDFHNPSRRVLTREFRMRIVEEAIKNNIDLIITSGSAGSPTLFDYYKDLIELIEKAGGELSMVHLTADPDTLLSRVDDEFRKEHGKKFGQKEMHEILAQPKYVFDKYPDLEHQTIDTSKFQPDQAAQQIIDHYHLANKEEL